MKILTMPQGSPEWFAARRGIVTASDADKLVTPEWKIRTGDGVRTFLYQKLTERLMGVAEGEFGGGTWAMDQGKIVETIAIPWYEFTYDVKVDRVGFCLADDGKFGCSPDGLVGSDGGLEIKSPQMAHHFQYLIEDKLPKQYRAQVQMCMLVTGRQWWRFVSFSRFFPSLVVEVKRDEQAQEALHKAITAFNTELDAAEAKIRGMETGSQPPARARK